MVWIEINCKKKTEKYHNFLMIKQHASKQPMGQQRNQRRNQNIYWGKWTWKYNLPKSTGCSESSSKRKGHIDTGLPQEIRKISNNITLHIKGLEKKRTKSKVSRRKEMTKIRMEIN